MPPEQPNQPAPAPQQAPPAPQPQPVAPPPPAAPQVPAAAPGAVPAKVPFYRSYYPFAAIFLLLPILIGLVILLTGEIYRKDKSGVFHTISKREKTTLIVVAIIFQLLSLAITLNK